MSIQTHPGNDFPSDDFAPSQSRYKKGLLILSIGIMIGAGVACAVSLALGQGNQSEKGRPIASNGVVPAISPRAVPAGSNPWAQWEAKQQLQQPQQMQTPPPMQSNGALLFNENASPTGSMQAPPALQAPGQVTQMITPEGQTVELMPGSSMSTTASGYPIYTSGSPKAIDQLADPGLPYDPSHEVGRNGLQGNPCVDPSTTYGRAYDRKQGY